MPLFDEDKLTATFDRCRVILRASVVDDGSELILGDIASLIRRRDESPSLWDEEGDYVEDLIGTSFVVLQTKINRVASDATALNDQLTRFELSIPAFKARSCVRALGQNYKDTGSTLVQLIWDVGNYFKHRDEWLLKKWYEKWDDKGRPKQKSLASMGIERIGNANLRTAYEFMGIVPHSSCVRLAEKVQEWADQVYTHSEAGLPVDPEVLCRARARRHARYFQS